MAFASEFEYEDELELELLDVANESDFGLRELDSPNLIQFQPLANNAFSARVSGFDWKRSTSPDPDVVALHKAAVKRIVSEIIARTPSGSCVRVLVAGFADPGGEKGIADTISEQRANAIANQILNLLPAANKPRVSLSKLGMGAVPIWKPSDTHKKRALNRRVEVTIGTGDCGMML